MPDEALVLAENVVKKPWKENGVSIKFDVLCPKCGRRHRLTEIMTSERLQKFVSVGRSLPCGKFVTVRMPWDEETV